MTVGIPRAFLYYRYKALWERFFETLGVSVVVSRETDKEIMKRGSMLAIDESCLSSKVYLGHVDSLLDRCDMVFVPRIASFGQRDLLCTKFFALYDIVNNTFRDHKIKILDCNIDLRQSKNELSAFQELGKKLSKKKAETLLAYMLAKQAEQLDLDDELRRQDMSFDKSGMKILVVGHSYNVYDRYIGKPVLDYLQSLGVQVILADICDRKRALERSWELTDTLPWILNREQVGAVQEYRYRVDGMVLLTAFPCGPDSLVNEVLLRRVKDLPTLNLILDGQEGSAGVETRLESFIDIIRFRQEGNYVGS